MKKILYTIIIIFKCIFHLRKREAKSAFPTRKTPLLIWFSIVEDDFIMFISLIVELSPSLEPNAELPVEEPWLS